MEWVIIVILLTTIVEFRNFVETLCTSLSIHVLLCGKSRVMLSRRLLPGRDKAYVSNYYCNLFSGEACSYEFDQSSNHKQPVKCQPHTLIE